ncbi:MAG TPA: nuclear transport factor 2 family protein [Steroidobacteraceae bacterium]|nr:nuclear transport factor 2 family protein [Steroidobacteraceae bacterium]
MQYVTLVIACVLLIVRTAAAVAAGGAVAERPSAASALTAEHQLAAAILANDVNAIGSYLAGEWIVVSATGGIADRAGFLGVIKSDDFSRSALELSEARVRRYGNVAVVTVKLATSGMFNGKNFNIHERETDVFKWRDGRWQAVLSHETMIPDD